MRIQARALGFPGTPLIIVEARREESETEGKREGWPSWTGGVGDTEDDPNECVRTWKDEKQYGEDQNVRLCD